MLNAEFSNDLDSNLNNIALINKKKQRNIASSIPIIISKLLNWSGF